MPPKVRHNNKTKFKNNGFSSQHNTQLGAASINQLSPSQTMSPRRKNTLPQSIPPTKTYLSPAQQNMRRDILINNNRLFSSNVQSLNHNNDDDSIDCISFIIAGSIILTIGGLILIAHALSALATLLIAIVQIACIVAAALITTAIGVVASPLFLPVIAIASGCALIAGICAFAKSCKVNAQNEPIVAGNNFTPVEPSAPPAEAQAIETFEGDELPEAFVSKV